MNKLTDQDLLTMVTLKHQIAESALVVEKSLLAQEVAELRLKNLILAFGAKYNLDPDDLIQADGSLVRKESEKVNDESK